MTAVEEVRQVVEQLVPSLQAEGYTVYIEPSRQLLPPFMEGYVPDVIALRSDKNLAIEVKVEGSRGKDQEERLKRRFENAKDWELRVYYVRPAGGAEILPQMKGETIQSAIGNVENLTANGQSAAALLIGWGTFEALGRALSPEKFSRPQSPKRLIEILAADGIVTPSEADLLRTLGDQRNRLVHGGLDQRVEPRELTEFVAVLKTLRKLMEQ